MSRAQLRLFYMPTYDLEYAKEHLNELFHDARLGNEVILMRADGKICELVPLAEIRDDEEAISKLDVPTQAEPESDGLVPA